MKAYKGFDKDLKCRDFQYEIGKEYEEDSAEICKKGFHACEHPLDVFNYYAPANSRFCEVEIDDNGQRQGSDSKVCGKHIKIGAEIGIPELVKAAIDIEDFDDCTYIILKPDKGVGINLLCRLSADDSLIYIANTHCESVVDAFK